MIFCPVTQNGVHYKSERIVRREQVNERRQQQQQQQNKKGRAKREGVSEASEKWAQSERAIQRCRKIISNNIE